MTKLENVGDIVSVKDHATANYFSNSALARYRKIKLSPACISLTGGGVCHIG